MLNEFSLIIIFLILGSCAVLNVLYINLSENTVYATFSLILVFLCSAFILLLLGIEFMGLVYITVYVGAISVFFIFILMIFDLRIVNSISTTRQQTQNYLLPTIITFGFLVLLDSILFYCFFLNKKYSDAVFLKYIFEKSTHEEFAQLTSVDLRTLVQFYQKNFNFLSEKEKLLIDQIALEFEKANFSSSSQSENVFTSIEHFKHTAVEGIGSSLYNDHFISFIVITLVLLIALIGAMAIAMNSKEERQF